MKKALFMLLCFIVSLGASAQYSGSGTGTESDPYLIYNETQLYQMNNFLGTDHAGVVFKLMKDLDLTDFISENFPSEGWMPVGVSTSPFKGKFYGNNHTISGLWINRTSINYVGFFGYVSGATITDFNLGAKTVAGNNYVGVLAGYTISTTFSGCKITGTTSSTVEGKYLGGIVGLINSTNFTNCDANLNVSGVTIFGGIAGSVQGTCAFSNCHFVGNINGSTKIGGITGELSSGSSVTFSDCHSKGKITATGDYCGGVVGYSDGGRIASMESCSHFGDIEGKNYVGGLVGIVTGSIEARPVYYGSTSNTTNTKKWTSTSTVKAGTVVTKVINNCTAIGNITGTTNIGGLIGSDNMSVTYTAPTSYGQSTSSGTIGSASDCCLWRNSTCVYSGKYGYVYYNYYSPVDTKNTVSYAYKNSYFSGNIIGTSNVGGIAGYKQGGSVQYCYTNASIYGSDKVGGIVGDAIGVAAVDSEGNQYITLKSNVAINTTISATVSDIGRIYGKKENDYITIGALASAEGNRALTTTQVIKQGVVQTITDDLQNGNVMGKSLLRLKANYVALGWDFDNNWTIQETECYPYKNYQAAPPVIESELVSQDTEITGSSYNGGTVYLYYKDQDAVSTTCNGNSWSFTTEALQSGAQVQLYADVDGLTPSYLTTTTVGYPGSGTEAGPYRIYTAEDLQGASNKGYYKLMNDIDLTSWITANSPTEGWVSIGRNSGEATYIDGDGHKITGLWINTTQDYTGLFSNFSAGTIKNLTVEVASGKKVKGGNFTGILIGRNANGQVTNCSVKGDVEGTTYVGGVTGYSSNNTLESVVFDGSVTTATASANVGGIAGYSASTTMTKCRTTSTVSSTGNNAYVGGLVGYATDGTINKCYATTSVSSTGTTNYVGGLVGYSNTPVTASFTTGTVAASGDDSYTGGLIGYAIAGGSVTNCYSTANITGTEYAAGLVGYTFSTIDKSYAKGNITGVSYGAGIVGELDGTSAALTNSIAANNILTFTAQTAWGSRVVGGFKNGCSEPNSTNYALSTMQVSLNGVAQKKTDDAVEGVAKDAATLMSATTYQNLGWDFNETWAINDGQEYPYLLWEVDVVPVQTITLSKETLLIAEGRTATLSATIAPLGATNKRLVWTSSDTSIITVADGTVTALKQGTATITVTAEDGHGATATCAVTVCQNRDDAIAALQAIVAQAQSLYDNSTEGTVIGNYEAGARAELLAVINSVNEQISSTMDEETIANCTNAINTAISTFESHKITSAADTDISKYDNILYIENVQALKGQSVVIPVKMKNAAENITGLQFDLHLPEGVTFAKDSYGDEVIELATDRTTLTRHSISWNAQADGSMRIACTSLKNYTFTGTDGIVCNLTLNLADTMEDGDYAISMTNIELTTPTLTPYIVDQSKSTLSVISYTLGDVNADGKVTVTDAAGVVNFILNVNTDGLVRKAADINCDDKITVTDAAGVVNIILGVTTNSSNRRQIAANNSEAADISIAEFSIAAGETVEIPVALSSRADEFTAMQFDINLPEGLRIVDIKTDKKHLADFSMTEEGARVASISMSNATYAGNGATALQLVLAADGNVESGTIGIENVEIVRPELSAVRNAGFSVPFTVNNVTGIESIENAETMNCYDLQGRQTTMRNKGVNVKKNGQKIVVK